MVQIRTAVEQDIEGVQRIFEAIYQGDYAYPEYLEVDHLKRLIFSSDTLMLVAEEGNEIIGTAAVVLESGAYTDLVGEFGRLAVHPDSWGRGLGAKLLEARVEAVRNRLHVGFMEARVTHPFSLTNGLAHGFSAAGFLPLKLRFGGRRESAGLLVKYFDGALEMRRNHPRVIPETYKLASSAMQEIGLEPDFVVDERAAPYPRGGEFEIQELTTKGYSSLLRIERGRLRQREIFGPLRLHYGFFRLRSQHSTYLLARRGEEIVGAVGFTREDEDKILRIFELISLEDKVIWVLLEELERRCREEYGMCYVEIDVSAHAPRMQRTLLELSYLPVAYVPALAFHRVERLDVVKMARLFIDPDPGPMEMVSPMEELAGLVLKGFERQVVVPRIGELVDRFGLFRGLNQEQRQRLAGICGKASFSSGEPIFREGEDCDETYLILDGSVSIEIAGQSEAVGEVGLGECLGEVSFLSETPHSADAIARKDVKAAVLRREDLEELVRQRPDIGVVLFRNLARGLGEKLRRSDLRG